MTFATLFEDGSADRFPVFLQDGRFVYHGWRTRATGETRGFYLASLGGEPELIEARPGGWEKLAYAPGFLFYVEGDTLFVREFDEEAGTLSESPRLLVEGIPVSGPARTPYSVSRNGVLVYQQDPMGYDTLLRIYDRSGNPIEDATDSAGRYSGVSISPDGGRVAYARGRDDGSRDIYVRDLARGNEVRRTVHGDVRAPIWSADGSHLAYAARARQLFVDTVGASSGSRQLTTEGLVNRATGWSPDARVVVYQGGPVDERPDLFAYWVDENRVESLSINTEFTESGGVVSPDGEWIAYVTDRSGQDDVWVARFPSGEDDVPVSVNGGFAPQWRGDGRELFYVSGDRELVSVAVDTAPGGLATSNPTPLFPLQNAIGLFDQSNLSPYSVTADGERFLVPVLADIPQPPIHVILNWEAILEE